MLVLRLPVIDTGRGVYMLISLDHDCKNVRAEVVLGWLL